MARLFTLALRLAVSLALLCSPLSACKHAGEESEPAAGPKKIQCAPVQSKPVTDSVEVRGTVAPLPSRDAQLAPQVAGRLLSVEVREGDAVKAKQEVARVDEAPLLDAVRQADAVLAKTRAEARNAQTTLKRIEQVFEHGIAARQEVDDAVAREAAAEAAAAEAEASAHLAHRQLDRAVVRSPLSGVVLKVLRKPGELVDGTPGTPVVEIADISELELVADVPPQDLVRISRGAKATITFSALPDQHYAGQVSAVAPSLDRMTGVGVVRVGIEYSKSAGPPVGLFGVAHLENSASRPALLVPGVAVRSGTTGDAEVIICGTDKIAHVRKVQLGATRDGFTEIRGEVAPGDRVGVEPVLGISDGDAFEAVP